MKINFPVEYDTEDAGIYDANLERIADADRQIRDNFTIQDRDEIGEFIAKTLNESRWIPVTERLPEAEGAYLVQCDNGKMRVVEFVYSGGLFLFRFPYCEHSHKSVIAWRPLPESYQP